MTNTSEETELCEIWNDAHDCGLTKDHQGDHRCKSCGDIWNRDEFEVEDCADPVFRWSRPTPCGEDRDSDDCRECSTIDSVLANHAELTGHKPFPAMTSTGHRVGARCNSCSPTVLCWSPVGAHE